MLLSRIYKAKDGTITLNDKNVWDYKIKEFAKNVAVVHQKNQIYGDLDVKTIVGYGRFTISKLSSKSKRGRLSNYRLGHCNN